MKIRTVALYGENLVMSTIGASLQKRPEFQVQQINRYLPDVLDRLATDLPDAILFDLAAGQPDFAINLMRKHPMVMLIGVDLLGNQMLVLSGEQLQLLTADDLAQVMEGSIYRRSGKRI